MAHPRTGVTPSGREEVRRALVAAAGDLFAERGPARVSVRDVAAAAGVNHGLVHRYIGSKDDLLGAVLDELAAAMAAEVGAGGDAVPRFRAGSAGDRYLRVLAHAVLDGAAPERLQHSFPLVGGLVDRARQQPGLSDQEARVRTARAAAEQLGWRLFAPFLARAAGLAASDAEDVQARIDADTADLLGLALRDPAPADDAGRDVRSPDRTPTGRGP